MNDNLRILTLRKGFAFDSLIKDLNSDVWPSRQGSIRPARERA